VAPRLTSRFDFFMTTRSATNDREKNKILLAFTASFVYILRGGMGIDHQSLWQATFGGTQALAAVRSS
jgi:hypothetical protein